MASDNMKQKMMQMTSRQKIIIGVMIVVILIIVWQIKGLISSNAPPPPPTIQPVAKMNATNPNAPPMKVNNGPSTNASGNPPAPDMQMVDGLRQAAVINDPQFNRMQRITEEKYVGKLNELEELRIQRQIAETNQAIAAAKLATVTAEKDISDLLTKPSPTTATFGGGTYVKTSVDVTPNNMSENEPPKPPITPPQELAPYKLISVSMLFNKWTAIVSLQDTMFSVSVGDTLPPDGSVVTNINKNSVTLRKDGKSRKVNITASI